MRRATLQTQISDCCCKFQSTLSMRRATTALEKVKDSQFDFNPRSPCGERQATQYIGKSAYIISIHALHAESDNTAAKRAQAGTYFNPRSPCGERRIVMVLKYTHEYFNPRSPCGERLSELRLSMCH